MQNISVLVVEDNPLTGQIVKSLLLDRNYSVDLATTGIEALEKFKNHVYHLIFMDIGLPNSTGHEVTQKIREYEKKHNQSPTLIIGLTALIQKEIFELGIKSGMNEVISKPLTPPLLETILQRISYSEKP